MSGTLPARSLQAFLLVAEKEGDSVQDYAQRAEMSASTMSRNLLDIGERNRYNHPGHGLVIGRDHLANRRLREYHLTEKGRALIKTISKQIANNS
jgi:DNA-binding MarR family transcriptional regulator